MPRILTGAGILVALLAPALAFAAYNDVALTTDAVLSVNGITLNVSGTQADIESITVNATNFSVTLLSGSTFQVTALNLEQLNADTATGRTNFICNNSQSLIKYAPTANVTVTITPSATLCSSTNSGGNNSTSISSGSSATPAVPATPATPAASTTPAVPATPATPAIPASGLSVVQIQSILDVLASFDVDAATMASVRAALEGTSVTTTTTTGSVTSTAVGVFKANLTVGSLGSAVKALQQFLNAHGYTVAASGAGSSGNETTKFGGLTKAALIKYQKAKGITPAVGYFGPLTRAAVEADQ